MLRGLMICTCTLGPSPKNASLISHPAVQCNASTSLPNFLTPHLSLLHNLTSAPDTHPQAAAAAVDYTPAFPAARPGAESPQHPAALPSPADLHTQPYSAAVWRANPVEDWRARRRIVVVDRRRRRKRLPLGVACCSLHLLRSCFVHMVELASAAVGTMEELGSLRNRTPAVARVQALHTVAADTHSPYRSAAAAGTHAPDSPAPWASPSASPAQPA